MNVNTKTFDSLKELAKKYNPVATVDDIVKAYSKYINMGIKKFNATVRKQLGMIHDNSVCTLLKEELAVQMVEKHLKLANAKQNAKLALTTEFDKAVRYYRTTHSLSEDYLLQTGDWKQLTNDWLCLKGLQVNGVINNVDDVIAQLKVITSCDIDTNSWSNAEKLDWVADVINQFTASCFTETLHKEQTVLCKTTMNALTFGDNIVLDPDNTDVLDFTVMSRKNIATLSTSFRDNPHLVLKMTSSEDGISRMLDSKNLSAIVVFMGQSDTDENIQKEIDKTKARLFKEGFTDKNTGKHYMFAFQNPSSSRKANFMFVEANTWDDVFALWCKTAGFKDLSELTSPNAGLLDKEGKVVMAKLLARLSVRGSNSFNFEKVAAKRFVERVKDAKVVYVRDIKQEIFRPYKTLVAPDVMEMKYETRIVTPGDGQAEMSFEIAASIAAGMKLITEDEYDEFMDLWQEAGKDANNVDINSRLAKLIHKIPSVFQIRHGEKKGLLVRANLEAIPELVDVQLVIPDSVRKFIGAEWKDYPLEICAWLKPKRKPYVALNPQFLQCLKFDDPAALKPIIDYWLDFMEESIHDVSKAMEFHGIINRVDSDVEYDASVGIVPQALRTNSKLLKEAYVASQRKAQYQKFIDNMMIGKLLVPGTYTYMICDPYYILNKTFNLSLPCLKGGENVTDPNTNNTVYVDGDYYYNGMDCNIGCFRAPLIHPAEAQSYHVVNNEQYWHMCDVVVFNGFDGAWDREGGGKHYCFQYQQ